MAKISIIDSIHVQRSQRLDAEYYKPEFLEVLDNIRHLKCRKLKELVKKVIGGPFGSTILVIHYTKKGIPFIRVADVKDIFIQTTNLVYVDPSQHKNVDRFILQAGDIITSRIGTLGLFSLLTDDYKRWFLGSNLIAIKGPFKMNRYFLLIFLNSKYGKFQILRDISGQVQEKITTEDIENILIPQLSENFQLHIEQLVKQAYEKRKLAEQKYQQAEELLYDLLGIGKEEIERLEAEKAYETNFKEVKKALRFDAEYYHPKYYFSDKIFKQIPSVRLGSKEYFELKKGIEVGSDAYCDKNRGVLFLRVSNLSRNGLKLNPSDKYIFKGIYEKLEPKYEPKEGEVLFSKDGTIGTATVVDSDFPPFIISGGVVRIIIKKDFDPYYLAFILNSILSKLQVTREKTGTVIEHLRFSKLKEIKVPKLPPSQQQEIANLVKEYFKLRKEARQLIQRAIREVEEAIENASRSNGE